MQDRQFRVHPVNEYSSGQLMIASTLMIPKKSFCSLMLPVLGFMKYFVKFQNLSLTASNLPAIFLEGLPAVFLEGNLSRFSGINAQYSMNLFPKAVKIARKKLFTGLLIVPSTNFIVYSFAVLICRMTPIKRLIFWLRAALNSSYI